MAEYRISGVWKNSDGTITHYAFHKEKTDIITRAKKVPKSKAIKLIANSQNSVTTWVWNYKQSYWQIGETVEIVNTKSGSYLRSNPDDSSTNNLAHLIDYDWINR